MLAELVAFTLQCTLPSSTPITITKTYAPLTTCAVILAGPPPEIPSPCINIRNCFYINDDISRYKSWQSYCDAQTDRPCKYDTSIKFPNSLVTKHTYSVTDPVIED